MLKLREGLALLHEGLALLREEHDNVEKVPQVLDKLRELEGVPGLLGELARHCNVFWTKWRRAWEDIGALSRSCLRCKINSI